MTAVFELLVANFHPDLVHQLRGLQRVPLTFSGHAILRQIPQLPVDCGH